MTEAQIERGCLRKRRYLTRLIAEGAAAGSYRLRGVALSVYACVACGGFHLTKQNAQAPEPAPARTSQPWSGLERRKRYRRKRRW